MTRFKRILFATDFSACSRGAEQTALALARSLGAEVFALHVVELPAGLAAETLVHPEREGPALKVRDYVTRADSGALQAIAARFRDAGVAVTDAIALGPIAATIVEQAQRTQADLIVLGTHGRTGLRRVVLGSVAEALVRVSAVPVLVVRGTAEEGLPDADEQVRVEAEG